MVVALLSGLLAGVFSSPDRKAVTIADWARANPLDFVTTGLAELDGTSTTATYGPPYNHTSGAGQKIGPVSLQRLAGVRIPVDTARDFVLTPLGATDTYQPPLRRALVRYEAASASLQGRWIAAYDKALQQAHVKNGTVVTPSAKDGPLPVILRALLQYAQSGGLDGALVTHSQFYATNYTKPLLMMADSTYLQGLAMNEHLLGGQWGMMNETGNYPGQAWLWLYTFWYQIAPFKTSTNADALIWAIMAVLTLLLILVPFIPGLREIPRAVPVYRLIWRDYYRSVDAGAAGSTPNAEPRRGDARRRVGGVARRSGPTRGPMDPRDTNSNGSAEGPAGLPAIDRESTAPARARHGAAGQVEMRYSDSGRK